MRYLVIKNIAYFPSYTALNSKPVYHTVLDTFQAAGIQTQENSMNSDAAVIWSVLWHGRMRGNRAVFDHYRKQNKPVVIIEIGALYRGDTWKISVNHITADGYYGHKENLNWDRPARLGISLATLYEPRPEILLALQHRNSQQVADIPNMEHWVLETMAKIRAHTDRPIVVRPHPRSSIALPPGVTIEKPRPLPNTYDSFDMHFDCHAVVNYNSGPGIQAAIAGCRPIVDRTSLAFPVSVDFADIESPYDMDRQQWLVEICHTEHTLTEIKQGLWLKRIEPALTL